MATITVHVELFPQRCVTPGQPVTKAKTVAVAVSSTATVRDAMAALEALPGPDAESILLARDGEDLWDLDATLASLGVGDGAALAANVHPDFRGCG